MHIEDLLLRIDDLESEVKELQEKVESKIGWLTLSSACLGLVLLMVWH